MIETIQIKGIATYADQVQIIPAKINFFYGGNGTGKTTLSKVLSGEITEGCLITRSHGEEENIVVYNRSFVRRNFSEHSDLPGIFTLGKDSIETQQIIEEKRKEKEKVLETKDGYQRDIDKLNGQLDELLDTLRNKCWEIQTTYGPDFPESYKGFRGSKERFCDECIRQVIALGEDAESLEHAKLQELYSIAYTKGLEPKRLYPRIQLDRVKELDDYILLKKKIVGKSDTPIGTFIAYLQASDWVKEGIGFAHNANGKCPYCQRELPHSIEEDIENYFDETYTRECNDLKNYYDEYIKLINSIKLVIDEIKTQEIEYLNYDGFDTLAMNFLRITDANIRIIGSKVDSPSSEVSIESIYEICELIDEFVKKLNASISENNRRIENQKDVKKECNKEVWLFTAIMLKEAVEQYQKQRRGRTQGITKLKEKVKTQKEIMGEIDAFIRAKEALLTSVKPTVDAINNLLFGFGYTGFLLAENPDQPGTYKIIRPDGSDASDTLSEGEHNFISFLYFYHLCFGSQEPTGINKNRVLVIDDPISSLDSNILFVIATLVKDMISCCRNNERGIKQVFVLTHNVYFHKEITFFGSRDHLPKNEVHYHIIRKHDDKSSITMYEGNPIQTSYELLWENLRNPDQSSSKGIFNAMRRILEHYFLVIGGIKYEECINQFEGEDKIICRALIAYINDGSHSIFDDLIVPLEDSAIDNYRRVFKLIFEKLNHLDHYKMMMKIEDA